MYRYVDGYLVETFSGVKEGPEQRAANPQEQDGSDAAESSRTESVSSSSHATAPIGDVESALLDESISATTIWSSFLYLPISLLQRFFRFFGCCFCGFWRVCGRIFSLTISFSNWALVIGTWLLSAALPFLVLLDLYRTPFLQAPWTTSNPFQGPLLGRELDVEAQMAEFFSYIASGLLWRFGELSIIGVFSTPWAMVGKIFSQAVWAADWCFGVLLGAVGGVLGGGAGAWALPWGWGCGKGWVWGGVRDGVRRAHARALIGWFPEVEVVVEGGGDQNGGERPTRLYLYHLCGPDKHLLCTTVLGRTTRGHCL